MEKVLLKRCLLISGVIHVLLAACILLVLSRVRPRAVGAVEVALLPLASAPIADGRAPGHANGSSKPAGKPAALFTPRGAPVLRARLRTRMPLVIAPHRDAIANHIATHITPGRPEPQRSASQARRRGERTMPATDAGAADMSSTLLSKRHADGTLAAQTTASATLAQQPASNDPAGNRNAREPLPLALGAPEARDASLREIPAPDFDFKLPAVLNGMPGTKAPGGAHGAGLPAGRAGAGGASRNRGFLGAGLVGEYFADPPRKAGDYALNEPFTYPILTRFVMQRLDPAINFIWDMRQPAPGVPATYFSVRWSGKLLAPATDVYTFYLERLDDGARLYIDGKKVVESWMVQQGIAVIRAVPLEAGIHDFRLVYCQGPETHASIRLAWSAHSFGKEIIRAQAMPIRYPQIAQSGSRPGREGSRR